MYAGDPRALYSLPPEWQGVVLAIYEARAQDVAEARKKAGGGSGGR